MKLEFQAEGAERCNMKRKETSNKIIGANLAAFLALKYIAKIMKL